MDLDVLGHLGQVQIPVERQRGQTGVHAPRGMFLLMLLLMLLLRPSKMFQILKILVLLGLVMEALLVCLPLPNTGDEPVEHAAVTILRDRHVLAELRLGVGPPNVIRRHWNASGTIGMVVGDDNLAIEAIAGVILVNGIW